MKTKDGKVLHEKKQKERCRDEDPVAAALYSCRSVAPNSDCEVYESDAVGMDKRRYEHEEYGELQWEREGARSEATSRRLLITWMCGYVV